MLREAAMTELCESCQLGMAVSCEQAGALGEARELNGIRRRFSNGSLVSTQCHADGGS